MFFKRKKEDEIKNENVEHIHSTDFCEKFCILMIPHLQKGKSVAQSWNEIKWLLTTEEVPYALFEEGLFQQFSEEFLAYFERNIRDSDEGGLKTIFIIIHHLLDEKPEKVADVLGLFEWTYKRKYFSIDSYRLESTVLERKFIALLNSR